ncbi:MAG: Ni-sirohydrochlorin a,c-diamide reductive cyclase catalytic subunit [Candidatus Methanoplasma sp.]|jgi:putative methanogenesis marker 13 metalloprotein|nr:Ni-sirohydrochlorin a,c-diamide reductive cyclase catalytic subunit [Candidatus Methanoplasma sp.]
MSAIIHPRPNPIVAALYTLRDMEVEVSVIHGPAGCGFMAARMLELAGMRVVTSGMREKDLVFGGVKPLTETLKTVKEKFDPKTVAVVGTCSSMIIGDDVSAAIRAANIDCNVFPVDCHACMGDNTLGAVKALEAGRDAGIIGAEEAQRQKRLLQAATQMERTSGLTSKEYLQPTQGPTKLAVCRRIVDNLRQGKKVAVVMLAKKELAYRFADVPLSVDEARRALGGSVFTVANLDPEKGLPRIRRYAREISEDLENKGVKIDEVIGGLDEYAVMGEEAQAAVERFGPDLLILAGLPHAYPGMSRDDILITDQPRQLFNYLSSGYSHAVGEISSHSMVMNVHGIVPTETGDTLREIARG